MEGIGNQGLEIIAVVEVNPGDYISGEGASYEGAGVRPKIDGIVSGKGAEGDIHVVGTENNEEVTYGRIVDNDAVEHKIIPSEKSILKKVQESYDNAR